MNMFGLTATDIWLLSIASTCIALLIPFWRERHNRKVAACATFRATVLNELLGLYPSPTQWPSDKIRIIDVLEAKFPLLNLLSPNLGIISLVSVKGGLIRLVMV